MKIADIPLPARMAHLPKDRRGYPIPTIVYRDKDGNPHFAINNEGARQDIVARDCCSICGQKLFRGRWLVGGPKPAFSERGLYIDPPMHEECAKYALAVCPYLAAPSYAKRIDTKTLKRPEQESPIQIDLSMDQRRPEVFVAIMFVEQENVLNKGVFFEPMLPPGYVRYFRPRSGAVRQIEVWRGGGRVTDEAELAGIFAATRAELRDEYGETGRADLWRLIGMEAAL